MTETTPFEFDRYVNGVLMAEGVTIERQPDLQSAMRAAVVIASRGPRGEVPVLVYRPAPTLAAEVLALRAERDALKLCVHHANDCADAAIEAAHAAEAALSEARAESKALVETIKQLLRFVPDYVVECRGDKCREPWCASCNSFEYAENALSEIHKGAAQARAILAASGGDGGNG